MDISDKNILAKDTVFYQNQTINCRGRMLFLDEVRVMGILNVTPDSFFDGGKYTLETGILQRAEQLLTEGADIIDIGGYSSRPYASELSEEEEMKRLLPAIETVIRHFPDSIISADTFRCKVAKEAINCGASIINDISGGTMDDKMFEMVASLGVPYILMHIQGTPQTMQVDPAYKNVFKEVLLFFSERTKRLKELGVKDIIIDPGFGFGKTMEQNYLLLKNLDDFKILNLPLLAGLSRKSMVTKVLGCKADAALNGTTVLNTIAVMKGAKILRVHDVIEAREAIKICKMVKEV